MKRIEQIEQQRIKRIEKLLKITDDPSGLYAQELINAKRLKFKTNGIELIFTIGGKEVWNDEYFHPNHKADNDSDIWANHMIDFAIAGQPSGRII